MSLTEQYLKNLPEKKDDKKDEVEEKSVSENVSTIIDTVTALPGQIFDLATGTYKQLEFPDAKETTQIEDVGFFESLLPNVKSMFARNDFGKAEIIADAFEGDERFGGVATDKFKNPFIVWNGERYYINKPGVSRQDVGSLVGEIIKYLPASKAVGSAKTIVGKIGTGLPAYTATEGVGQVIESAIAPKTDRADKRTLFEKAKEATGMGALATGIDVVTPPLLRAPVEAVKGATRVGAKILDKPVPDFAKSTIQSSKYPITQGQRTAEPYTPLKGTASSQVTPDLEAEDIVRNAPSTDPSAKAILQGLDEKQLNAIRDDAKALQSEMGSGTMAGIDSELVPLTATQEIKDIVTGTARDLKKVAGEGYTFVKDALKQPFVSSTGVKAMANNLLKIVDNEFEVGLTGTGSLDAMPLLKKEIDNIKKLSTIESDRPFNQLASYQKEINRVLRTATPGTPEQRILGQLKSSIDDFVFNGIEQGFITGNDNIIQILKNSKDLYKQYINLSGKKTTGDIAEQSTNQILKKLSNPGLEADAVVNSFFGHSKFNPAPVMANVLKRFKAGLPEEKYIEVTALLKDAILEKAFAGKGKSGVTRTNIVNNYNEVFKKNKNLIDELFSKKELKQIEQFRDNVMPTLWAEIKLNPSGTSYTLLSSMARTGLLNYLKILPFVKEGAETVQTISNINKAKDMVKQYITRADKPLFDFPLPGIREGKLTIAPKGVFTKQAVSAPAREEIIGTEEVDQSAIKPLVESISQKNIGKILESIR
jgi:hypothetical protein